MTRRFILAGVVCAGLNAGDWKPMFDGRTLDGWKATPFSGSGPISVRDGALILGKGRSTGVNWTREFPKSGYEIRFEAARLEGRDFFAGLVFPVGDSYCSWISGGWDGTVVGLSNIDDYDASENETSTFKQFDPGRWYKFRLEVTASRIRAWIDEQLTIDTEIRGRKISLRFDDSDLSIPLGFSSYATEGGIRGIEYRLLDPGVH